MDGGRLVDDGLVLGMIRERLAEPDVRGGFILDGFPRNLVQAAALDGLLAELRQPLDAVVQFEVDAAELVRRISGRRTCADCGRVFNVLNSPPPAGDAALCPRTGAPHRLMQRPDDNEATVAERLRVYVEKTQPLIAFYRSRGLLRVIDAQGELDAVTRRLARALGLAPGPAAARVRKSAGSRKSRARAGKRGAKTSRRKTPRRKTPRRKTSRRKTSRRKTPGRAAAGSGRRRTPGKRRGSRRRARR
jgi:adenylate kinase